MGIIKTRYDRNYFENYFYREQPHSQRNINRVKELLLHKDTGELLEIGCAEGNFLKEARRHFYVTGLDISPYAVERAQTTLGDSIRVGDIQKSVLPPRHYDAIVAFNILEHFERPANVIEKLYGALAEGGVLVGSVPNNYGIVGGLATLFSNLIDRTHCSTYPPHVWGAAFAEQGFRDVSFFGEIMLGRNNSFYVKNRFWESLSFNLMFVCTK